MLRDLAALLPGAEVLTDPARLAAYGYDMTGRSRGTPAAAVRPSTTEHVATLMALSGERGFAVVPRAAGSNLCGAYAPPPGSVVLDCTSMSRIVAVDAETRRAVVEPGVINAALQERLAPLGLCFSPDPASRPISTIGGNIACNAGGPGCIKHGVTFHHVAAVELAIPGGKVVTLTDADPVDLLGVVVGSEGTLGVVTQATLRLRPLPEAAWTALAAFARLQDACETVGAIIAARVRPAALELIDRRGVAIVDAWRASGYPRDAEAILIAEVDGSPEEVVAQAPALERVLRRRDPDVRVAADPADRAALWAGRLGFGLAAVATGRLQFVNDVTVPRQRIPEVVAQSRGGAASFGLDCAIVAHAGDGNTHPVTLFDPPQLDAVAAAGAAITDAALALGGTITGEHGVGVDKLPHMRRRFAPPEIAAFRAIKDAFDPEGLCNPGVLYPPPAPGDPGAAALSAAAAAALEGSLAGPAPRDALAARDAPATVAIDEENLTVEAGGAARCADVAAALRARSLRCDAFEHDGAVAETVASGSRRAAVRASLLCVEAEMPHGRVRFGSAAMKDVAGLDAKRLLAGSDGRFGRIASAIFRAEPA